MTDRPILFSGPMVRALLAGTKTQTRRVVTSDNIRLFMGDHIGSKKPSQELLEAAFEWAQDFRRFDGVQIWQAKAFEHQAPSILTRWQGHSTYGVPGDVLWVRESAWYDRSEIAGLGMRCFFEGGLVHFASGATGHGPGHPDTYTAEIFALNSSLKKRPGIHMPRWASRISLRITDVRIERLQDISEADARAEGILTWMNERSQVCATAQTAYRAIWEDINGLGSWAANPWVWAVSFERIQP
jgi:hypothetical protein